MKLRDCCTVFYGRHIGFGIRYHRWNGGWVFSVSVPFVMLLVLVVSISTEARE